MRWRRGGIAWPARRFAVTLSRSIYRAVHHLLRAPRPAREGVRPSSARGENGGETDNARIVKETLALRAEKARLLGYESFAALKLDDTMAKTPDAVIELLVPVWEKARDKASKTRPSCSGIAVPAGSNEKLQPGTGATMQEKLRAEKYAFDEAELKPYLQLDKIIDACFDVATRLFGLSFDREEPVSPPGIPTCASSRCSTRTARVVLPSWPIISTGPPSARAPG
jgi:peptidyl-dipeptidase Dcp